jgi:2'-5' RNA ligase
MNATNTKDTMRLFYALWPDDATRAELMRLQTNLHGRMTHYDNLHITLAFLGQQPTSLLPALKDLLGHLPKSAMTLRLDRVGYFTRNRIAWVGMHEVPDALFELQGKLTQALLKEDIAFDSHSNFKPHVTLARDASMPPDLVFTPITWQANQVALVQSKAQPDGVSYRVLESRALDEDVWTPNELGQGVLNTGR